MNYLVFVFSSWLKKCLFFFLLFFPLFIHAQKKDTLQFYVNHASTGILNQTNLGSSFVLNNLLKFNLLKNNFAMNTTNGYVYGEQGTLLSNNDYTSTVDFNLHKTVRNFYYWGLATYDKSYSLKINNRLQSGIGVAYSFWNKPDFVLGVSNGIIYEYGDMYNQAPYSTLRNSLRLKYKLVFRTFITWDGTHFFQPSLSSFEDYIIKSNSTLSFKLYKWLSLSASLTYNKLSLTGAENLLSTFGLNIEKYF